MSDYKQKKLVKKEKVKQEWICHCCMAKNCDEAQICSICHRDRTYVIDYHLPLHGAGAASVRPEQLSKLIPHPEAIYVTDSLHWTPLHSW